MLNNWSEGDIQANGIKLHYYRTGTQKPTVLLAHGLTDNGLCWTRLVKALVADYDFVILDARGHGLSEHTHSYLPEDHAQDLLAVINELKLGPATILGHSMGALNAAYLAAFHPDAVKCLVLEDPPWPATPEHISREEEGWRKNLAVQRTEDLDDILSQGQEENPNWDPLEFLAWAESKRQLDPNVVSWLNAGKSLNNWRDEVRLISCPSLLITGDTDVRISPEVAAEAQSLNSSLETVFIDNAGHSVRRDQFDAYLKAVKGFLDKHL